MITITFNPTTPKQMAVVTAAMTAYVQQPLAPSTNMQPEEIDATPPTNLAPLNFVEDKPKKAKKPPAEKPAAEEAPEPITLEQLRAKMAAVSQAGKGPECKALLVKFGASNLTSVPAEKYGELMNEVGAL